MKGAIIGDIIGSAYERKRDNIKTKDFPLFQNKSGFTDDSLLTVAVADALIHLTAEGRKNDDDVIATVRDKLIEYGSEYVVKNWFGRGFRAWVLSEKHEPYYGFTNGAIMRCSSAAWVADSADEAERLGGLTAMPSHNHPDAVKAASALCRWIYLLRHGMSQESFREIAGKFYTIPVLDEIRPTYKFDMTCVGTMSVSIAAFCESTDFEDAIRNAISIGGDSDTIAAVTGSLAEAYYGVPDELWNKAKVYLLEGMVEVVNRVYQCF